MLDSANSHEIPRPYCRVTLKIQYRLDTIATYLMEDFMFRKVSITLLSAVIVASGISAVPASAAAKISNVTACSNVNATTSVSG